ncbi:hypothetical protein HMPREF9440_00481 [Sutterella parvirubra YIT 11816]|uniref:Uncharacterized protein n=1 Tax=Sutterella parvirubra YIT 11816 TaxID=762967 RepID=H3KCM8_9BURK|nr:hypothetical protein HMPREF9440_00481 [Sutterella parvirubra YIT 11816]
MRQNEITPEGEGRRQEARERATAARPIPKGDRTEAFRAEVPFATEPYRSKGRARNCGARTDHRTGY